jgi:hypothetical protein
VRKREKVCVAKLTHNQLEARSIPYHFRHVPRFYNHSDLALVNQLAADAGVQECVHSYVCPLPEDNGERFFSTYLHEQIERNRDLQPHPDNDRCQCLQCAGNPITISGTPAEVVEVPIHDDSFGDDLVFGDDFVETNGSTAFLESSCLKQHQAPTPLAPVVVVTVAVVMLMMIPSAAIPHDQVLAGTKHGFERPKMQIE